MRYHGRIQPSITHKNGRAAVFGGIGVGDGVVVGQSTLAQYISVLDALSTKSRLCRYQLGSTLKLMACMQ